MDAALTNFQALANPTRIAIGEALRIANSLYALRDPVRIQVRDLLKQYISAHLNDTLAMLGKMGPEQGRRA